MADRLALKLDTDVSALQSKKLVRMRVLAVTNMFPTAESPTRGTFVEQQVKSLRTAGLDVDLLFVDRAKEGMKAYRSLPSTIAERIEQFRPDILHSMYGGVMARAVVKATRNLPAVVSFCGSDLLGENLPGLLRKVAVAYGVWCSRFAARHADGVIVKSRNLRDALPATVDGNWVRIIPNGVDLDRFKPMNSSECRKTLGWRQDRFHVLFPANSGSPCKRFWLAEAALKQAAGLGVPAELRRLQGVKHEEVPLWLNASNCLILTSDHEGSPNIVKEALACNRPVISVDVGDVAERIAGIRGCYLAEPTPEALGKCLHEVYRAPQALDSRSYLNNLSLGSVASEVISLYEEVIHRWQSRNGKRV